MKTTKTTISIDPVVKERAFLIKQILGYNTLTGLVTYLINEKYKEYQEVIDKL